MRAGLGDGRRVPLGNGCGRVPLGGGRRVPLARDADGPAGMTVLVGEPDELTDSNPSRAAGEIPEPAAVRFSLCFHQGILIKLLTANERAWEGQRKLTYHIGKR